jgi:hypothetical protein
MAYTNIDDPSAHFQVELYTGNSSTNTITFSGNSNMKPDLVWNKRRDVGYSHRLWDSNRGVTKYFAVESSGAEATFGYVSSFNTDGITFGNNDQSVNVSGGSYVLWNWKANGGTTSSNTTGSITSTVQANTTAGFSIITYTGTGSAATVGHGLGVAPKVIIVKARTGVPTSWAVFHKDGFTSDDDYLVLQTNAAKGTQAGFWNNQYPSSTVFGISNDIWLNGNGVNFVAYAFAEKQGYSKFGKYVGNGNANGAFVYTGFKPAFVMTKSTSPDSWSLYDNKRLGYNPIDVWLRSNGSDAESTSAIPGPDIDILSNGFKLRNSDGTINGNGNTYIYMAFAENPFTTSTGVPACAR